MIIADTDVLIDYLAGMDPAKHQISRYAAENRLQTTAITCFELLSGAGEGKRGDVIRTLLDIIPILPLDRDAAVHAAEVRRHLAAAGQPIGMGDSLIAGIVLTHEGVLFTRNQKHFARVPRLKLVEIEA